MVVKPIPLIAPGKGYLKYILEPPKGGTLIVKDPEANQLIKIDVWCRHAFKELMPMSEDESRN